MAKKTTKALAPKQREAVLASLEARFDGNARRHKGLQWDKVRTRLEGKPDALWSLHEMEGSGGEPDVIGRDETTGEYLFVDCATQSPSGRRSVCYDDAALKARKEHKPKASAVEMATAMGAALLTEDLYRRLQQLGEFDTKTSVTTATALSSSITTVRSPTMPPGGSVAR